MKEKIIISRRQALRHIFSATGCMVVSPSLMSFYNQLTDPSGKSSPVPDKFFIERIREALKAVDKLPAVPSGTYKRNYEIYSLLLAGKPLHKGSILLNLSGDTLSIEVRRLGASPEKYSQFIFITQKVRRDALLSPINWSYKSYLAQTVNGSPYRTPLEGKGAYDGKEMIVISEGAATRKYHTRLHTTMNWNLLPAINGIAKNVMPVEIGVIDAYDLYAGKRKIQPFETDTIESNGKTTTLHSLVMTGQSVLPTFFWLDETGIPLFVNSGTEVYILNGEY